MLNILSYQYQFLINIKHRYWTVNIYPDKRHYLIFDIPKNRQIQSTYMLQGVEHYVLLFIVL